MLCGRRVARLLRPDDAVGRRHRGAVAGLCCADADATFPVGLHGTARARPLARRAGFDPRRGHAGDRGCARRIRTGARARAWRRGRLPPCFRAAIGPRHAITSPAMFLNQKEYLMSFAGSVSRTSAPVRRRVSLVTGGTEGIGRAVAVELARRGERVLFVGRNEERGAQVLGALHAIAPCVRHQFLRADLSLLDETARVAEQVALATDRLDAAVFCAGVLSTVPRWTLEGLERNFVLNY